MSNAVQQILNQKTDYSSYSAQQSFTLSDILAQRDAVEEELLMEQEIIDQDMFDDYFDDQYVEENEGKEETTQINITENEEVDGNRQGLEDKKGDEKVNGQQEFKVENGQQSSKDNKTENKQKREQDSRLKRQSSKPIQRTKRIQTIQVPPLPQIKNISFLVLGNVTAAFDQTAKGVGIPTVITSNSIKYLAIGTSFGNVVLFEVGNKGKTILGTAQNRKYGSITSIAISRGGRYLVCGQENGMITTWDLATMSQVKKQMATEAKIVKIIFCSQNQFILADIEGNVLMFTIENYFWVKIKKDRLFEKSNNIFYDVKIHTLQSGLEVIVLCSIEQILIATYAPKVEPIDCLGPPDDLIAQKIANIEIGKTAILSIQNPSNKHFHYNDVLCVSWSNVILVYQFKEGIKLQKLQLIYRFTQQTPIYNMEFISEGVLVTLDKKDTFRSFRVWINDDGGHKLLNQKLIPQEVIYQRFMRDSSNRHLKIFNNTLISCSFNPKQKELFFICKNSIYRCRVFKWHQYVSQLLLTENKLIQTLKICVQIFYRRLDIFLQPVVINDKSLKLFCQVAKIYTKKRFDYISQLQLNRASNFERKHELKNVMPEVEQTFDCVIEYMLQIRCPNQLFQYIYQGIVKTKFQQQDEYHHKFLDCLQPFILAGRLNSLPSKETFQQLLQYYLPQNKRQLIDNFIMFLNVKTLSLFYEEAISICSQNKLYQALAYVCSTHGDFVSPLTRMLNEIRMAQDSNMNSALDTYYTMLKDYIIKLLGSCYINGISFEDQNALMKKSLSNWLMCKETFLFFTKNQKQSYHQDYFYFIQELVYLLSSEPQLEEYIHHELKHITEQDFRGKEIAQLFIKISGIITLDKDQVDIIVEYSTNELIQTYLDKYLHFYKTYEKDLSKIPDLESFYKKNKQLHYFHLFLKANQQGETPKLLQQVNLLEDQNDNQLNGELTKYILNKMSTEQALWNLQDLLKIHSENTMIFTLQRFPLQTVNERLVSINDPCYRYIVVRKILKLLRKQNKKDKIKKYHAKKQNIFFPTNNVTGSNLSVDRSRLIVSRKSKTDNLLGIEQLQRTYSDRKKLGKQIMQFYVECLCKYKNEKRVYYELICNMSDYYDIVEELITIIQKYNFNSCLGILEQTRQNYQKAYEHYEKVYRHFFFEQNYKKLIKIMHCHGRFMRRIFQRMLTLTSVMNKDDQWMQILKCIISPLQEQGKFNRYICDDIQDIYAKVGKTHPFLRQLGEIIEQCLINVSSKIAIEKISSFIGAHSYVFSRMFVLQAFRTTLLTYSNSAKIFSTTNEMITNHEVSILEQIYSLLLRGVSPNIACLKCQQSFNEEYPMHIYTCGHAFHKFCPSQDRIISRMDYRYKSVYPEKSSQMKLDDQEEEQAQEDKGNLEEKCPQCEEEHAKGQQENKEQKLPDFHKEYEENLIVKGMVGIVTIIPNMISAIPGSLNYLTKFMSPEEQMLAPPVDQPEENIVLDDAVLGYLAFTQNLQNIQKENDKFIDECSKYFNQSL